MVMRRYIVPVTTDSSGDATSYSPITSGRLHAIHYFKNVLTPFATGVDFTITLEATGEPLWVELNVNASTSRYPRVPTHKSDGTAALYAATFAVLDYPAIARDRVKIVVSSGGDTKDGAFVCYVDG